MSPTRSNEPTVGATREAETSVGAPAPSAVLDAPEANADTPQMGLSPDDLGTAEPAAVAPYLITDGMTEAIRNSLTKHLAAEGRDASALEIQMVMWSKFKSYLKVITNCGDFQAELNSPEGSPLEYNIYPG